MQIMGQGDGSVGKHASWESPIVSVQSKNLWWREPNPGGCFLTSTVFCDAYMSHSNTHTCTHIHSPTTSNSIK